MPLYPTALRIYTLSQYVSQGFNAGFAFAALHRFLWDGLVECDSVAGHTTS